MRKVNVATLALALLLWPLTVAAQRVSTDSRGVNEAIPVRCVNTTGTAFEACGGAGAATQAVTVADGADTTLGAKADAKSTATDATPISIMSVLKEISAVTQAPPSQAVTNAGTFAVQATVTNAGTFATQSAITAASGAIASGAIAAGAVASGAIASGAVASGAVASGAFASGAISDGAQVTLGAKADAKSTATDTTAVTVMQVLKEISFMAQTPAALPSNQSVNVAQINGVAVTMGNGAAGTGVQRVAVVSDNSAVSGMGVGATGAAVPANANYIGGSDGTNTVGYYIDPCQRAARLRVTISQTSGTQVVTGTSAKQTYICDFDLVTATAQNIVLVSGTGSVCVTSPHAMAGGTTAATGWNFAANGGLVKGSGGFYIYSTGTAADNVCILQSGSGQISGSLTYVQY